MTIAIIKWQYKYNVGFLLMSNKRTPCFPAEKWRFDDTDPHCCFVKGRISVDLQIKTNFFAESTLLCMARLLDREGKQKSNFKFSPWQGSASTYERVSASGNALKQSLTGKVKVGMNELPVIGSLCLRRNLWDSHWTYIATR